MGTRADFYVGIDSNAEWLGSVAWDGYPQNFEEILQVTAEEAYRSAVEAEFASREDATRPADGWPWPWSDSSITDYAYAYTDGGVLINHGDGWRRGDEETSEVVAPSNFPDMSSRQNVTFGPRGGILLVR